MSARRAEIIPVGPDRQNVEMDEARGRRVAEIERMLAQHERDMEARHRPVGLGLSAVLVQEAQRMAEEARAAARPASDVVIVGWLARLARAVANPPSQDDFPGRAADVTAACGGVAAPGWSGESLAAAMAKFDTWPPVAKIAEHVRGYAAPASSRAHILDTFLRRATAPVQAERTPPTALEVAAVRATLAAVGIHHPSAPPPRSAREVAEDTPQEVARKLAKQLALMRAHVEKAAQSPQKHIAEGARLRLPLLEKQIAAQLAIAGAGAAQ